MPGRLWACTIFDPCMVTWERALSGTDIIYETRPRPRQMQDNGSPPDEIVGDIPPELANMPGMGGGEEQCSVM